MGLVQTIGTSSRSGVCDVGYFRILLVDFIVKLALHLSFQNIWVLIPGLIRISARISTEPGKSHFTLFIIAFHRNIITFYRITISIYRINYNDISNYYCVLSNYYFGIIIAIYRIIIPSIRKDGDDVIDKPSCTLTGTESISIHNILFFENYGFKS